MKKKRKIVLKILIPVLAVILVIGGFTFGGVFAIGGVFVSGKIYGSLNHSEKIPNKVEIKANEFNTITAVGKGLYDSNGNRFNIRGINYGNLLIAEGWMSVNSLGASYNEDGSFKSVNDQGVVEAYEETYQEEIDKVILERFNNGDFTKEQLEELADIYFYSYCTEMDFKLISDMGLNTIRLPMYYRNFMEGPDDNLVMKENPFEKLDYFLENAKKYDLKVIIDMHGVVGGQSGYEHSGTRDMDFWENETYINSMCELWKNIAQYYMNERGDLASTILAYDLVNEPVKKTQLTENNMQWKVLDKLYDAIREIDKHHVISIEGVWYPISLPKPEKYGWENVLYQYHFYNWSHDKGISNEMYYTLMDTLYMFKDYNCPKFVGEFNFFNDTSAWSKYLNHYDNLGWGWAVWNYKVVSVGWWDNSWGLVVHKLFLENSKDTPIKDYKLKLDLKTASFEEIKNAWLKEKTSYNGQEGYYKLYEDGLLYNVLKDYFGDNCKIDKNELVK